MLQVVQKSDTELRRRAFCTSLHLPLQRVHLKSSSVYRVVVMVETWIYRGIPAGLACEDVDIPPRDRMNFDLLGRVFPPASGSAPPTACFPTRMMKTDRWCCKILKHCAIGQRLLPSRDGTPVHVDALPGTSA